MSKKTKPTEEQALILAAVQRKDKVLIVEAGAGTGKTTTLRMIADVLTGNGQYTAFNSSLVAESKHKFQGTKVAANTTHSLGFRAEGKRFAHRLNGGRVKSDQLAMLLGVEPMTLVVGKNTEGEEVKKTLSPGYLTSQVMGAIRRFCQSDEPTVEANHFRYIDGIDVPTEDGARSYTNNEKVRSYLAPFATKAWADLCNPAGQLPFSHDHYVKVWQLNKPVIAGDYILLDEAQDTAPVMLDILRQQGVPVILVGDSAQQIYEWRGAVNALSAFGDAPRLFLSQSFRFGEAIAEVANAVLETLDEATPLRLKGLASIPSKIEAVAEPRAILCRTNAMAVASLLEAIAAGKKPFLVGGGSDVVSFVEAAQSLQAGHSTSHPDLACFSSWNEVKEYSKLDEGEDLKLMVKLIDSFSCETILKALKDMPIEKDADVTICTAHKSKGREWDSVRLTSDFPTKSKCSDSDRRLLYVAVTRAKLVLDVSGCPFFNGKDGLDISSIATSYREAKGDTVGLVEPAPSSPVAPAAEEYTWSNYANNWCVRGPKGNAGKTVTVTKKNGSKQQKTLREVVKEFETVALYSV